MKRNTRKTVAPTRPGHSRRPERRNQAIQGAPDVDLPCTMGTGASTAASSAAARKVHTSRRPPRRGRLDSAMRPWTFRAGRLPLWGQRGHRWTPRFWGQPFSRGLFVLSRGPSVPSRGLSVRRGLSVQDRGPSVQAQTVRSGSETPENQKLAADPRVIPWTLRALLFSARESSIAPHGKSTAGHARKVHGCDGSIQC